ncbi:MAG: 16S rRNA (uracil(1498)-N(3))-methyltransferase [Bacteroidota bacterium]
MFYSEDISEDIFVLSPEESRHCIKVLRHKSGDQITVTDGKGIVKEARITSDKPNKVGCQTLSIAQVKKEKSFYVHIAISPTKNMDRIEWFVEKSCEMDIDEISFVFTDHSERKVLKTDRLHKKSVSAMKQSGGLHLCKINEPLKLTEFLKNTTIGHKMIAYVNDENPETIKTYCEPGQNYLILIGPEGDFSPAEVSKCIAQGFKPVSLGSKVLRTETAGVIACHSFNFMNDF